ncbi:MAG: tetratricopeptide repeat protein [candidate division KSB1 bacterium]|nr:tetratricopeptide repeat protein [candidate division KSB1 bacterium]
MLKGKNIIRKLLVVAIVTVAGLSVFYGCAITGETQTKDEAQLTAEEKARQKAKQDSLQKAYRYELLKAYSTGNEHHKNKNFKDAIPHLWTAAEMDTAGEFKSIYRKLGDSYMKLDKPDSALVVYNEALDKFPENDYYWRTKGWLLSAQQQNDEAIEAYYNAIEYDDDPPMSDYKNLGRLLVTEDRIDQAIEIYQKIVELNPQDADAQSTLASLFETTGDIDAVIEAKEAALENRSDDTALMFDLARLYYRQGDYNFAIEKFTNLLEIKPEDFDALEFLGNSYQYNGKYRKAIGAYEKALALKPDNARIMTEMAACYKEIDQVRKAMNTVNQAINMNSSYGMAYIVKGEIYSAVADKCIASREKKISTYDDKLVYQMAYNQYQRAANVDPTVSNTAEKRMRSIKPEIPTTEDKFLHPDKDKATLDCYQWLY